ncbi:MAG: hypothetical protein J5727_04465 [Kiritimatiellae bacterium]|nr:hypothetical protein [Kiritimatiellia bacterium]
MKTIKKTLAVFVAAMVISLATLADGLPSGYHLLDWADTDGTGWINTLYRPDCTNAVEMKASVTETGQFLYCSRYVGGGAYNRRIELYVDAGLKSRFAYGTNTVSLAAVTSGTPCVFAANPDPDDLYKCYCSASFSETVRSDTITEVVEFTPVNNAYFCLFGGYSTVDGLGDNTPVINKAVCRFFYFKVWDSKDKGELKCHIVPVYGVAEKAVGLYDLVADRFLPVKGGGVFAGSKLMLSEDECWPDMDDMFTAGWTVDLNGHNLTAGTIATNAVSAASSAYQDLEYVTADGTAANVIAGFRIPGTAKVEVKVRPKSLSGTPFIFCSRTDATTRTYTSLFQNSKPRFDFHSQNNNYGPVLTAGEDYAFVFDGSGGTENKAAWSVNGAAQEESSVDNKFTSGGDLVVLGSSATANKMSGRIYYLTITTNSTDVLLDLRPVRRLSDGVVGLYDRVGDAFYTNGFETVLQPVSLAMTSETPSELRVGQKPLQDGTGYADISSVFAAMDLPSTVSLVKNGKSAFDGSGSTIAGKLKVNAGTVSGVTLLNGATLDISSLADPFSLDENAISFADGATIYIDVGARTIGSVTPVVSWTVAPSNIDGLLFRILIDGNERALAVGDGGLYLHSGLIIFVK